MITIIIPGKPKKYQGECKECGATVSCHASDTKEIRYNYHTLACPTAGCNGEILVEEVESGN